MKALKAFKDFLVKSEKYYPASNLDEVSDIINSKRFWLYAESLGEFRLALYIIDIIKSILSEKKDPDPIFFISFKTFSTLSLAQTSFKENKDATGGRILYFFHPFLGLGTIFKKYVSIIKPNYFISVQHPVSKKLIKELLNTALGKKLIFTGISAAGLKKMGVKVNLPEGGFSLSAVISRSFGADAVKINAMPMSLKYISCFGKDDADGVNVGGVSESKGKYFHNDIVISFVSVHKKESAFILKFLKEIVSDENMRQNFNLKFIFVPRNIKNSRRLFESSSKIGLNPLYYGGNTGRINECAGNKALIVDKYGALDEIYPLSDIVYVGKSLFKNEKGGHNVLEPASYGKAIITGSYAVNFKDIIQEMLKYSAVTEVTEKNFKEVLTRLITNEALRRETGQNGLNFCLKKRDEFKTYFKNYLTEIIA
ncbi:MAG: 3-deoxy-D-manno-octulosonic acid transferase [bacterium]